MSEYLDDVILAEKMPDDELVKKDLTVLLGNISLDGTVTVEQVAGQTASLANVANEYSSNNYETKQNANLRLKTDLKTNVFEILKNNGHITNSRAKIDEGSLFQFGYNLPAMYAHGAVHVKAGPEKDRREIETLNSLRFIHGCISGLARTHYFIEASQSPDNMESGMFDYFGYDGITYKCKIRCSELLDDNEVIISELPVAGKQAGQPLHDKLGVAAIHHQYNINDTQGATRNLDLAFWVPKEQLPFGVASLAETYDRSLGVAFCGVKYGLGDYSRLADISLLREQKLEAIIDNEVAGLVQQIRLNPAENPLKIMGKYAKDLAARLCAADRQYDARQFGPVAAQHIETSRFYRDNGYEQLANSALRHAQAAAVVTMCGMRIDTLTLESLDGENSHADNKKDTQSADCDYISEKCPLCNVKKARTHETKYIIECRECRGFVKK